MHDYSYCYRLLIPNNISAKGLVYVADILGTTETKILLFEIPTRQQKYKATFVCNNQVTTYSGNPHAVLFLFGQKNLMVFV